MDRLFTLDAQFLFDAVVLALSMLVLFTLLSYLLFNPVREMLEKRRKRIEEDTEDAKRKNREAQEYKEEYEQKLKEIKKEADIILQEARKKAAKQESGMLANAREEADRIVTRAQSQIRLEKEQAMDEMKQEIVTVASMMAGKIVSESMDQAVSDRLIDETLREIGEQTWQS